MGVWFCDRLRFKLLIFAWRGIYMTGESGLKSDLFLGIRLSEQFLYKNKLLLLRFWVLREINSRFCSKTRWQMFLLVSGRHVGAHLGGHQHGVSIQISLNLGRTFLRISSIRKIAVIWILARVFAYVPSFYSQILDSIYWTVLIFYFDLFWIAWHWKPAIVSIRSSNHG